MSENAKTIGFLCVGLVAVALAWLTQPSAADLDVKSKVVNTSLTDKFKTPDQAKRLRIVRVDENTATRNTFEVAEKNGLWTIPSKEDYPADAAKQMAEAATGLMDRKILQVASENAGDHEQFGVVDPLGKADEKGVGTRVTLSDAKDQPLVDLIIGKEVKDAPGKRYVRVPEQSLVYVIEIDPSHLSTKFDDWIEKDLLKLNAFDLEQVEIKDYSAELQLAMTQAGPRVVATWDPRAEMTLGFNDKDSKWNAIKLRSFDTTKKDYAEFNLAEDEELNATSLNGLKTALDDLKIVDVARKPSGMSADLKAGEDFMKNREALEDLKSRGFSAVPMTPGAPPELICSDGEVIATMKNGTEYVLRFGDLVQVNEDAAKAAADPAGKAAKADPAKGGVHRYLFAMARFNEAAVPKPELQELPALPAGAEEKTGGGEAAAAGGQPADAATKSDAKDGKDAKESKEASKSEQPPFDPAQDEAAKQTTDEKSDKATMPAANADAKDPKEQPGTTENKEPDLDKIIADRKRIEAENQRKLDEYSATLKKGQDNVKDLNLRFGDWYFVVDNEVFTKVRLSRDAVVKKKDAKADGDKKENEGAAGGIDSMLQNLPGGLQQLMPGRRGN